MAIQVLAADDDPHMHLLLDRMLGEAGGPFQLTHARSPEEALELARERSFSLALVDLHFAGSSLDGFGLLGKLRDLDGAIELIVLSSSSSFADVQGAMRAGAGDYLAKGFGKGELFHSLERALDRKRWKRIERGARSRANAVAGRLLGSSKAMSQLRDRMEKFARSEAPVLVTGETGTGKELVAGALHAMGRDPAAPLIAVNCAALPASTIDSFFFGHERGAFTGADRARPGVFEEADGGTLFLDEVNSLPFDLQGRLLRVLQESRVRRLGGGREIAVDFRLVAATNQPMERLVREGAFREDLYFRLNVLSLALPPLRERGDDLEELVAGLLPRRRLALPLMAALKAHSWPGNVRELRNLLVAMDALADEGEELSMEHLPERALRALAQPLPGDAEEAGEEPADIGTFTSAQEGREREFLSRAYRGAGGNVSRMARMLGVDRSHLHQKLTKLGIHGVRG